jgi:hypothetical protein
MGAHTMEAGQLTDDERNHAQEEKRIRRFGNRCLTAGILLIPLTYLAFMGIELATVDNVGASAALVFAMLGILTLALGGTALIILGGMERLHRPVRKRQRHNSKAVELVLERVAELAEIGEERFIVLHGLAGPVPGRLAALESEVAEMKKTCADLPAYGQGVIDGAQMRRSALGSDID